LEKKKKLRSKNRYAQKYGPIGKQSGDSVESVRKKKMKPKEGRICKKEGFKPGIKERRGDG